MLPSTAIVIRDGKTQTVPLYSLVIGDLIVLKLGTKIPADIAKLSSNTQHESSILQKEITKFVITITCLAIITSSLTLIIWASWLRVSYPNFINLSGALINAIGVLVAYVPEGLPIAVTLTLT
ncbi:calcium ATPase [Gigaspora margarita]|uniref:Calcium ATPase n=1 Tax=Gigaspora margarita TaxID=4874 RepID=A0A8H4ADR3_GIGMA|nr:calcium ATPase [Gigaspora margarita]